MALSKGKWIRIECDAPIPNDYYHFNATLDVTGETYQDCMNDIKIAGYKKIKGKWYCPDCLKINIL